MSTTSFYQVRTTYVVILSTNNISRIPQNPCVKSVHFQSVVFTRCHLIWNALSWISSPCLWGIQRLDHDVRWNTLGLISLSLSFPPPGYFHLRDKSSVMLVVPEDLWRVPYQMLRYIRQLIHLWRHKLNWCNNISNCTCSHIQERRNFTIKRRTITFGFPQ